MCGHKFALDSPPIFGKLTKEARGGFGSLQQGKDDPDPSPGWQRPQETGG
jgi:hypothetical protein